MCSSNSAISGARNNSEVETWEYKTYGATLTYDNLCTAVFILDLKLNFNIAQII